MYRPITAAYRAAFSFVQTPDFEQMAVTREEYLEEGSNACRRKFHGWNKANEARQKNKESTKARGRNRDQLDDTSSTITALKRVSRKRQ
jgi:actin-related protein 6